MDNPFFALVGNSNKASHQSSDLKASITTIIESVFLFTLNKEKKGTLLYLDDISDSSSSIEFTVDILEHALFERILLTNAVNTSLNVSDKSENEVISYLYKCYERNHLTKDKELKVLIEELIMRNVATALKQPALYEGQELFTQMYDILKDSQSVAHTFFVQTFKTFQNDEDGAALIKEPFTIFLTMIHKEVAKANAITFPQYIFNVLNLYLLDKELALILMEYTQPKQQHVGTNYSNTLLGALMQISILPKTAIGEYDFFQDGLSSANTASTEGMLWSQSRVLTEDIHNLILNLLKCDPDVRTQILMWIGNCLKANADLGKLWNAHAPHMNLPNVTTVSDGFMINLVTVLVKLTQPFCKNIKDGKVLKVDPTYCAVPEGECNGRGVHLPEMWKETCLVLSSNANDVRCSAATYNFITEIFFMGHRAFDIGFRVLSDKLMQLHQEMGQTQRAFQEALAQSNGRSDVLDTIKERMESDVAKYLSTKCVMTDPRLLQELFNFISASAYWICNVAVNTDQPAVTSTSFAPIKQYSVVFPLSNKIPDTLKCIPEFVIENIVCYLVFLRRFSPNTFEEQVCDSLSPILTFILIFMGSSGHTRNPHLRARLAEALEALLPFHKDESSSMNNMAGIQRELLFKEHEHSKEIVAILLDVFVSIEMTGQNVQFEQKFNYRRPMYMVMNYLWENTQQKQRFRRLAEEAECNMEAVPPPIFLRFVNLLINDAIFLLDESLTNMAKLRELETSKEKGEWDKLPVQERAQNLGYLQHTGMIARFDNILGRDTIGTLEYLTSHITIVFTHNTMVDRVAAMLNYFLLKLVGPDKKNFKVKHQKEYHFDPAATVIDICKIYVHLKESSSFCLAVSRDGRSYSPQLFTLAEDVLVRIGGGQLLGELQDFAKKVSEKANEYQSNEEAIAEAPDHYLDPIMSTLMLDPVILPSSKQIVDRSTIARHLLSDQTDPFNRAPLSMDQIVPHTELATEIQQWLEERKAKV